MALAKEFQPVPPGIKKSTAPPKNMSAEAPNVGMGKNPFDGVPKAPITRPAESIEELRKWHGADGYDGYHGGYGRSNTDGYED